MNQKVLRSLNGLMQDVWGNQMDYEYTITKKELTMIQATITVKDQALEDFWVENMQIK